MLCIVWEIHCLWQCVSPSLTLASRRRLSAHVRTLFKCDAFEGESNRQDGLSQYGTVLTSSRPRERQKIQMARPDNALHCVGDAFPLGTSHNEPLVSELPDGFRWTCELYSRRSLEGALSPQSEIYKKPPGLGGFLYMARPGRFELSTYRFVAGHSIR